MAFNNQKKEPAPLPRFRDIEVLYPSGERLCYRMYSEMYERTMEVFLGMVQSPSSKYKFVVAYLLNWSEDNQSCWPESGKSYINLDQICSIDVIGVDSDRTQ